MDEQKIRAMIRQEIQTDKSNGRFGLNIMPLHAHSGNNDGGQISQGDIKASSRLEGTITFGQATTYKIATSFNPTAVWIHGNVTGNAGEKFIVVGNAQLGGGSFYLQPGTTTSTTIGGPAQNIIQSSTYFGIDGSSTPHTVCDEGHIVDVEYPLGSIFARATVIDFSKGAIYVKVENLTSGWTINLSFTIT